MYNTMQLKASLQQVESKAHWQMHALKLLNAGLGALEVGTLGVWDSTGDSRGLLGFRLWLQLVHCAYLLTLSKYFE